eukprot:m51a1_g14143 hypothetical protein (699) ;mRNA; f:7085-9740
MEQQGDTATAEGAQQTQGLGAAEERQEGEGAGVAMGPQPQPWVRVYAFGDDASEEGFASTWASAKATSEAETQCPPLISSPPAPPPLAAVPSLDALEGLAPFVARVAPVLLAALAEPCALPRGYDAACCADDERGDIALVSELLFGAPASGAAPASSPASASTSASPVPVPGASPAPGAAGAAVAALGMAELDTPRCCSAVAWNCTGALLAVAYGGAQHAGWCTHRGLVRVWSVFRRASAAGARGLLLSIETGTCATAVAFHPNRPSLLAVGAFTGQLQIVDAERQQADPVVAGTDINNEQAHREPITAVAWNCTGALLAVAYGGAQHAGWCTHRGLVRVWSVFRRASAAGARGLLLSIETGTCATAVAFHPNRPSLLAVGAFTGQLQIVDAERQQADPVVAGTDINNEQAHREPITSIAWLPRQSAAAPVGSHSKRPVDVQSLALTLATSSTDGRVIVWSLATPPSGVATLSPLRSIAIGAGGPGAGGSGSGSSGTVVPGITCVAWLGHVADATHFLAGTEGGRLYKCGTGAAEGAEAVLFNYEAHAGPVLGVAQAPMHRNVFATCGADGAVRLYNALQARAMLTLVPSDSSVPLCCEWSPTRASVFGVGCGDGRVYMYDLAADGGHARAAAVLRASTADAPVCALAFNRAAPEYVATADTEGCVRVWLLSSFLSEATARDADAIAKYGEISRGKNR